MIPHIRSSRTKGRARVTRERRGVAVVMFAVIMMLLMMFVAIAADFARMYVGRNDLQTAADAAAMAGALELMNQKSAAAGDTAKAYGTKNKLFKDAIVSGNITVEPGIWDDAARTFTPSAWSAADAVRATVNKYVDFQFAPLFGINGRNSGAQAIGWSGAMVQGTDDCVKPWAMPIKVLKDSIHSYDPTTTPNSPDDTLSTVEANAFDKMIAEQSPKLNFVMKQGTGSPDVNPGNFYNVVLPRVCEGATQTCSNENNRGASVYYDNIYDPDDPSGCKRNKIEKGDVLETQPGVSPQQTINHAEDFCAAQGFESCTGVPIKAAFFGPLSASTVSWTTSAGYSLGQADKDAGRFAMEIKIVGGFIIQSISVDNSQRGQPKSQITGRFVKLEDSGPAGPAPSLLRRTILVR